MASKDEHSNEDNRFGANTVEAANEYIEKEASLKREKARVKSNFTRSKKQIITFNRRDGLGKSSRDTEYL